MVNCLVHNVSIRDQSLGPEPANGLLDGVHGWRIGVFQLIGNPEVLPLEPAELMERQHVDSLDVAQARGKRRDSADGVGIVGELGHEHEPHPHRLADSADLELLRIIRGRTPQTPVIGMTAFPSQDLRRRASEFGAACLLEKPFDVFGIEEVLLDVCSMSA
jgi:DNA-binding NarL/FixJ family response regulator